MTPPQDNETWTTTRVEHPPRGTASGQSPSGRGRPRGIDESVAATYHAPRQIRLTPWGDAWPGRTGWGAVRARDRQRTDGKDRPRRGLVALLVAALISTLSVVAFSPAPALAATANEIFVVDVTTRNVLRIDPATGVQTVITS